MLQKDPGLHRGSLAGEFTIVAPEAEDEFFTGLTMRNLSATVMHSP